ncbi:dTDP-4-amino-4,6-dideoxygalactose transaminase [Cytophagaceae bacterium ABcell3]|nr:dTDP-4-amino-4,6-dideoxygalactose transaminase [Cytophagaceae bacterium ABcell3]
MIPFNKPFIVGKELEYIKEAVEKGKLSGDGHFTNKCQHWLEENYQVKKALLTTSCTDALEMAAILLDIKPGDEVIVPSFTFVSAANAFVLRGANIVFADIEPNTFNIDPDGLPSLISSKTKAIVLVHYAGIACQMDEISAIAESNNIPIIEDVALAMDAFYKKQALGSIGTFATWSFHETKNIICGEGGALGINNPKYCERAEIIREKGTNRSKFFRGETKQYEWVDIGSSFLPSEINAAYLFAQLQQKDEIQKKRIKIWDNYHTHLKDLEAKGFLKLPVVPDYATKNGQLFHILCRTHKERNDLIQHLGKHGIKAVFHYLPLHLSSYYQQDINNKHIHLPICEDISERIVRLPLFYSMTAQEQEHVIKNLIKFYI